MFIAPTKLIAVRYGAYGALLYKYQSGLIFAIGPSAHAIPLAFIKFNFLLAPMNRLSETEKKEALVCE